MIGLGRSTVYNLIAKGEIEVAKIGHRRLIPHKSAIALLERHTTKAQRLHRTELRRHIDRFYEAKSNNGPN